MAQSYDVVIKGTGMGEGEKVLVDNLMKAFIHTLAQRENLPAHIVFYGEGAKLTAKGSGCLEDLKELEKRGVKVMTCGICIDYYELNDHLEVGTITTMGEVVEILSNSNLIVEP
ncbi:sulfurtransferase-like selenium metabolism protein YedF [Leptotrichia sp. OH3620_COT-345]|uniref:sulfurtransferase-like selenium metabolism protein YedF n=1 Tax=Leptotrichia sp. OH3620_COT-345 TaxID=2491048 RepID=UPI000F654979|nr:sulfurtransferase-like selenium metabolism protein YedF [Leptotrichia sp. OH3620_COT-345]RRD40516.1 sulfurtransferase-like selenium metabolism protein YedF [Leptotrichia sp. OH3620_COT-345]